MIYRDESRGRREPPPDSAPVAAGAAAFRAEDVEESPLGEGPVAETPDSFPEAAGHADGMAYRSQANVSPAEAYIRRAYAAQAVRQKDHISAGLFAIFLGMFGMHKFYLGYNQAAFAMLAVTVIGSIVTFGLAGAVIWVISIIEGIIYLTKSQTDFDRIYVLNQREWF